jgi:hypothetical protein
MSAKPGRKADVYGKCEHCCIVYPARADCYPCAYLAMAERDAARRRVVKLERLILRQAENGQLVQGSTSELSAEAARIKRGAK